MRTAIEETIISKLDYSICPVMSRLWKKLHKMILTREEKLETQIILGFSRLVEVQI
jgi:hypothetical protein